MRKPFKENSVNPDPIKSRRNMPTNYSSYRHNIKSGDLLAWEKRNFSSIVDIFLILVQKIRRVKYSHVGVAIVYGERVMVLEANVPEVRLLALSSCSDFYHFPLGIEWVPAYEVFLLKELGKKYSLWNYLKYIFKIKRTAGTWYCTELAAYFYDAVGYIETEEDGIDPKVLTDILIATSGKTPVLVNVDQANHVI